MTISTIKISQMNKGLAQQALDILPAVRNGANISVLGNAGSSTPSTFPTITVSTLSENLSVNTNYIPMNAGRVELTLPSTAIVGDMIRIIGWGAGGFRISQNALQQIFVGNAGTTVGEDGYLESTDSRDSLLLFCVVANQSFISLETQGNILFN